MAAAVEDTAGGTGILGEIAVSVDTVLEKVVVACGNMTTANIAAAAVAEGSVHDLLELIADSWLHIAGTLCCC